MDSALETRALVRTSTAVDVIQGGDKGNMSPSSFNSAKKSSANALPETAYAIVNHRIAVEDSVKVLKEHYIRILSPLAKKWNFKLAAFGKDIKTSGKPVGILTLAGHDELEPSPASDHKDVRFKWLAGTLQAVFGKQTFVAPVLLAGELAHFC
jgi:Gly-Xaa carboxypeptidase